MLDRRAFLLGACALSASLSGSFAIAAQEKKTLTLYFTWSGSAEKVAREVNRLLGGDIARIETVTPYPSEYRPTTQVAKAERLADARPAVKPLSVNLADYDTVCLGHPIWGGKMPMGMYTFLENNDFSGKTVLHFNTHGGTGQGDSQSELARLLPQARVLEGLAVYGWGGVNDLSPVSKWLKDIGMTA